MMNILFIGDIVGSPGRDMLQTYLPKLKKKYHPNLTIVNGENAAAGKGITEKIYKSFLQQGVQVVTMGNHTWNKKEILDFIETSPYLIRPANFKENNPGKGITYVKMNQLQAAVINLQGRAFMDTSDDPFEKADKLISEASNKTNIIFIDFHAETTSEKQAFAWYVDGRVSAVIGTHTHTQTADERILPKGTAFLTDAGMTGPYDAILGVQKEAVINRFLTNMPSRFDVDKAGSSQLNGCFVTIDEQTGSAKSIERILINDDHPFYG